jgi:hypothetical protein
MARDSTQESLAHPDRRTGQLAWLAFGWALFFGIVHVLWVAAYFFWPAAGRATLGPDFEWAFSRPWTIAYDLVVAVLFVVASLLALAIVRPSLGGLPRWIVRSGLWVAGTLLFLRGAAGVVEDVLIWTGLLRGSSGIPMFYDFWFLLGGSLFLALAPRARIAGIT